jgi:membrane-associated phospholipid phosphatase
MPLVVVFVVALTVFAIVAFVTWHYPTPMAAPTPSLGAAKAVGKEIGHHSRLRRSLKSRLNPEAATGLALTLGLAMVVVGGLLIGVLAYLVRSNDALVDLDGSVAAWGNDHSGPVSEDGLNAITQLGGTYLIVALAVVVAIVAYVRRPNRWIPVFLLTVLLGQLLLSNVIKEILDRARPTFNPVAETLGPSFPSGHSTAAAAFWAAAALVLGRGTSPKTRALLAGGAAGIAVAVASTRVLLDVHWLSDVLAGLALGWAWFALCSIAFGGRMLRFGAAAEKAVEQADVEARSPDVEQAEQAPVHVGSS